MRHLLFVVALTACNHGPSRFVAPAVDEADDDMLLTCKGSMVEAAIVADLRTSYHELISCGALTVDFYEQLGTVFVDTVFGGSGAPSGLVYQGNGVYASRNGMMTIRATMVGGGDLAFDPLDP